MASRKANKREREPERSKGEPISEQASEYHHVAESSRARIWEMHLRGVPKTRIAEALGVNRATVARYITRMYAEAASERKFSPAAKLDGAIQRMRRVQEQAWTDHDEDDAREQDVLNTCMARATHSDDSSDDDGEEEAPKRGRGRGRGLGQRQEGGSSGASVRYQSQRSQYLRIILDAEKEIARLEGLYEGLLDVEGGAVFSIRKLAPSDVATLSARNTARLAAGSDSESDGEA